jgi:hypothetical protein
MVAADPVRSARFGGILMRKCPVCNWEIKDEGIKVKAGDKEVVVCCEECADKLAKQKKAPSKK